MLRSMCSGIRGAEVEGCRQTSIHAHVPLRGVHMYTYKCFHDMHEFEWSAGLERVMGICAHSRADPPCHAACVAQGLVLLLVFFFLATLSCL